MQPLLEPPHLDAVLIDVLPVAVLHFEIQRRQLELERGLTDVGSGSCHHPGVESGEDVSSLIIEPRRHITGRYNSEGLARIPCERCEPQPASV